MNLKETNMDDQTLPDMHQLGTDRGYGNLLGIEPYMIPQDYASKESFFEKLNTYLFVAQRENLLNEKTIILFPEHIGTWLVTANENAKIFQAATLAAAERSLVLSHPLRFGANYFRSKEKGRAEAAFFRMKADQMAAIYQDVFSRLARTYAVTIIAGSIVLPAPQISNGRLVLAEGHLRNVSVIYQPDGLSHPYPIYKAFPTSSESSFIAPASANDIPVFETSVGRLGVLICADSWYPQAYARLKEREIAILAVPSYETLGMQKWHQAWLGYDGWQAPADVDLSDIMKITEAQAWAKYSLAGRIRSSGASYGVNVFLRGKLWDQDLGGRSATLVRGADVFIEQQTQKAAILNLWL